RIRDHDHHPAGKADPSGGGRHPQDRPQRSGRAPNQDRSSRQGHERVFGRTVRRDGVGRFSGEVTSANQRKSFSSEQQIERVRRISLALPGTWEKISHGEPTWFVGKKVFAMFSNNHHDDGHVAVTVPAAIGVQEMLIKESPEKFYRPPYVGVRGWIGIEVDRVSDKELSLHIKEAWKLIAPRKLQAESQDRNLSTNRT